MLSDTRGLLMSIVGSQLRSDSDIVVSDEQILGILIAFGDRNLDARLMSDRLYAEFSTLAAILAASSSRLRTIEGMTDRLHALIKFLHVFKLQALKSGIPDRMRIAGSEDAREYLVARLRNIDVEELHALYLDNDFHLLSADILAKGTTNSVAVHPTQVLKRALQIGACKLIIAHNHPSRRVDPSLQDLTFSKAVRSAGSPLGITIEDSVIVAGENYISMRELGLM